MSKFQLMNKNSILAELDIINDEIYISKVYSNIPNHLYNINNWIDYRTNLFGRRNVLELAKLAGINSREEYIKIAKAISVNDTIWVNDCEKPISWDKVNPYKNRLSDVMASIAIDGYNVGNMINLKSPSPQYQLSGSVDKCIRRKNKELYLYKTAGGCWSNLAGKRPYSEYFVSQLCEYLHIDNFVKYRIKEKEVFDTDIGRKVIKPYCICKLFTSEDTGSIEISKTKYYYTDLETLRNQCNSQRDKDIITDMLMLDTITLNFDRHSGNYSVLIDNDTFNVKGMAPIYDNDCALGAMTSIQNKTFDEAFNEIKYTKLPATSTGDYDEQALTFITKKWYERLHKIKDFRLNSTGLLGISPERTKFAEYIIHRRAEEIIKIINSLRK